MNDPLSVRFTTPPGFQVTRCPLCDGPDTRTVLVGPDRAHPRPGAFRLGRCADCGAVFQNPRPAPERLADFYPADYLPYAGTGRRSLVARLGWPYGYELYRRCRFVSAHKSGGTLVDIGCATGTFLAGLTRFGPWHGWGIEMNLAAARVARQRGVDVVVARMEDVQLPPGQLDAVTMWDVLEHLADPVGALRVVGEALQPDGVLFLNVPVLGSLDAQLFGPYWCGLDLPRHLTEFDPSSLERALAHAGLRVVSAGCPTGSHYSFTQSLRQAVAARVTNEAWRTRLMRATYSPLLRAAAMPYFLAAESVGRGASLTVAARKA
jgi:SAM-dependent methyltransferase